MPGERKIGQDHSYYEWSPIVARRPLRWPDNARVAVCIILNLEHFDWQLPAGDPAADDESRAADRELTTFSRHEYGNRVGAFRLLRILDKHGFKPTIAMDKRVADHYPYLVRECRTRGLEVIAHGLSARRVIHASMSVDAERAYVRDSIQAVSRAVGKPPVGWLGPGFQESVNTPALLAAEGIRYVCDWSNDEQPFRMTVSRGELFSLGVDLDLDDEYALVEGCRLIDEYQEMITDTFDVLYRDGAQNGRMMVINLHPWVTGQPWRSVYVDRALAHMSSRTGVWKASGQQIIDWYKGQL